MKKKILIASSLIVLVLISTLVIFILSKPEDKEETKVNNQVKETTNEELILNKELSFEVNSEVSVSNLLDASNTLIINNSEEKIDTSKLGTQELTIKYLQNDKEEEKKVTINITDTTAPEIEYKKELTTTVNKKIDLLKGVKVSDNSKEEIKATVEGDYDFKKTGNYNLKYVAIDSSNNKTEKDFVLKVSKAKTTNNTNTSTAKPTNKPTNNNTNKGTNTKMSDLNLYVNRSSSTSNSVTFSWEIWDDDNNENDAINIDGYEVRLTDAYDKTITTKKVTARTVTFSDLNYLTVYKVFVKAYRGNDYSYEDQRSEVTDIDVTKYKEDMLKEISKYKTHTRKSELDTAANICAKNRYTAAMNDSGWPITRDCLNEAGVTQVKGYNYRDATWSGLTSVNGKVDLYMSVLKPEAFLAKGDNKRKLTSDDYPYIGIGYYNGVIYVIVAAYEE